MLMPLRSSFSMAIMRPRLAALCSRTQCRTLLTYLFVSCSYAGRQALRSNEPL